MSEDATKRLHKLTTNTPPGIWTYVCYSIRIPYHPDVMAAFEFYASRLNFASAWERQNIDNMTAEDIAQLMKQAWQNREIKSCMIGTIILYATESPPPYIVPCDGGTYTRADYPFLYDVIAAGLRIDASTFKTPDLRGRVIIGAGEGDGLTDRAFLSEGGQERVTLTEAQMPSHSHTYSQPTFGIDVESVGVPDPTGVGNPPVPQATSSAGGDQSHNNMQPYTALHYGMIAR